MSMNPDDKKDKQPDLQVKTTKSFKLKDRPGRQYKMIPLRTTFGFMPEVIIVQKEPGSQRIVVHAVMTEEELKKEEKKKKALEAAKSKKPKNA